MLAKRQIKFGYFSNIGNGALLHSFILKHKVLRNVALGSKFGTAVLFEDFVQWPNGGGTVHKAAHVDPSSVIETGAVVHSDAVLAELSRIGSGTIIGPTVSIGASTSIGYNVSLSNCIIGNLCVIHNGACVGQDGFGFFLDEQYNMVKKPQLLKAIIGNHVEIGANTCIDRGSWRHTEIGDHSKLDNLVQIGHNVVIGEKCLLCGNVSVAGSVTIGDFVTLGGRAAIRDHVSIASKVRLAANTCVTRDISQPGDYAGFPAVPINRWRRQIVRASRDLKK